MINRIHSEHRWEATIFDGVDGFTKSFDRFFDLFLGTVFAQSFRSNHPNIEGAYEDIALCAKLEKDDLVINTAWRHHEKIKDSLKDSKLKNIVIPIPYPKIENI